MCVGPRSSSSCVLLVPNDWHSPHAVYPWYCYHESLQFSAWNVFLEGNWSPSVFVTYYVPIVLFPILYVAAKLVMGVHPVKADDMDFVTDVAEFNGITCVPLHCRECRVRVTGRTPLG